MPFFLLKDKAKYIKTKTIRVWIVYKDNGVACHRKTSPKDKAKRPI